MPARRSLLLFACLCLLFGVLLASCSDEENDLVNGCDDLDALLASARGALADKLFEYLNENAPDIEEPDDVDFTGPRNAYREAYECDSTNLDARFGLAVTNMLMLSVDQEVNAAFDEWEQYLENNTPFEADSDKYRPLGIPLGFAVGREAIDLPFDIITHSLQATFDKDVLEASPAISRIQDILEDIVLETVDATLDYLEPVASSTDYTFIITGRMQGDEEEESLEIDHTDILAFRAACKLLAAACNIAVAYDVSFESYDAAGILAALDQDTGTMMTLNQWGTSHMAAVPNLCTGAVDDLTAGITSLLGEQDNQDDDIIKIGPSDLDEQEVRDIRDDYLPDIRQAFTGDATRTEDWDDNDTTPDAPLTVNLNDFFSTPIQDFKDLVPGYAVSTRTEPLDTDGVYGWEMVSASFSVTQSRYYSGSYGISYHGFMAGQPGTDGDSELWPALEGIVDNQIQEIQADPDWTGSCYCSASYYGQLVAGDNVVSVDLWFNYDIADTWVHVPVITWDDDTYEEWSGNFSDPTLSGLLPTMTSVQDIVDLFGMNEEGWEKELVIDWTDLD